jgi:BA14K-like protein
MKHLLVLRTRAGGCTVALGCIFFLAMNGSLVAQTTGALNPKSVVEPSGKVDGPPAGECMPIGITASGDVVFPFQCRDFIEQLKAADRKAAPSGENHNASGENHNDASGAPAVGQEPVAIDQKPGAIEEKTAANKEETLGPENSKSAEMPVAKAPLETRNEHKPREQAAGPLGCIRFRSYDPTSRTYRSYDGRRLSCRVVDRDAMAK